MNKRLFLIRNILFIIIIIPLYYLCPKIGLYTNIGETIFFLFTLLLISILVLINIIRKQDIVNYNDRYNKIFILTMIFILIVLLRTFFDSYLLDHSINKSYFINEIYFSVNSIYISISLCLISINNLIIVYTNKK